MSCIFTDTAVNYKLPQKSSLNCTLLISVCAKLSYNTNYCLLYLEHEMLLAQDNLNFATINLKDRKINDRNLGVSTKRGKNCYELAPRVG